MTRKLATKTGANAVETRPFVAVVDDDRGVLEALDSLLRSVGLVTLLFDSPTKFLASLLPSCPGCLLLDVRLPGLNGLDFQQQLHRDGFALPIVFMTGHGDIPMSVRAMKAGAVDFLAKPFREQDLLDAVTAAIARDRARRSELEANHALQIAYETLTRREREVMAHVTAGLMNKQVANAIGISEITVKIHRANVMRKMCVRSLADLVRKAEALGISRI